jgi:alpha-beta hydrolase superfamily lysophospholipase
MTRKRSWDSLKKRLLAEPELHDSEWFYWDHAVWRSVGLRPAESLARKLAAALNAKWAQSGPYDEITMVGHSMGGLIVRQGYLDASGDWDPRAERTWHKYVTRIVLFAATNRGADLGRIPWLRPFAWLFERTGAYAWLPLSDFLKGSDFITNLRLRWIRYFRTARKQGLKLPTVVQLLGTEQDKLVDASDSVDMAQFEGSFQFDVPDAGHSDVYRLDTVRDAGLREVRYALIRDAFLRPESMTDNVQPAGVAADPSKTKVVFVLHGIRDSNRDWVKDAETLIKKLDPDPNTVVIAPNQGYLSALGFLFPTRRRRPTQRFKDGYSQCVAKYYDADFHFLGHSNGTYQLGRSLPRIPEMKFKRVVLVGSVLPESYDWDRLINSGQVQDLQNHMSYKDWPVGWLCSGLHGIGMLDIGTGGYFGFQQYGSMLPVCYYAGGHSAPLQPGFLDELVKYVLGEPCQVPSLPKLPYWRGVFSRACPWIARFLVVCCAGLIAWLVSASAWTTVAAVVVGLFITLILLDVI